MAVSRRLLSTVAFAGLALGVTGAHAQAPTGAPLPDIVPLRGIEPAEPELRPARDTAVFVPVRAEVQVPVTELVPTPRPVVAVRRRPPEEGPWDPLGIRLGALTLRPSITQSIGYDSNPARVENGADGAAFSRTEGSLALETDWSRHALTGSVSGTYDTYRGGDVEPRLSGDASLALRLDVLDNVALTLEGTAATATERVGSVELPSDLAEGPQTSTYGGEARLDMAFNRLEIGLRGGIAHTVNGDALRADGTVLDRSDDDFTERSAAVRLGYAVSPRFTPFVEAEIDRRVYDAPSARRDSQGVTGLVGAEVEVTRLLSGEAAIGFERRDYDDPARGDADGIVGSAALVWTPTPLTTVTLTGSSALAETDAPGARAAATQRVGLAVSHEARRNLVFDASLGWAKTDYEGSPLSEELITATAGLEWRLTRSLAFRAEVAHERLDSTAPGGDHDANIALFGMRLTR